MHQFLDLALIGKRDFLLLLRKRGLFFLSGESELLLQLLDLLGIGILQFRLFFEKRFLVLLLQGGEATFVAVSRLLPFLF